MVAPARSLFIVAFAFVAGAASTSVFMSRGDVRRAPPEAPHAPSLTERLRAEAHGQSLPWSDPIKAAAKPGAPARLQFTPGPGEAPVERARAVADGPRRPGPQAAPPSAHPTDQASGAAQMRLAERHPHGRPPLGLQAVRPDATTAPRRTLAEDGGHLRARVADLAGPTAKPVSAVPRNLPALDAVNAARLDAWQPEFGRPRAATPSPYRSVRLSDRDDHDLDAPVPRRSRQLRAEASDRPAQDGPRARPRRTVAASDGLMRWLSGPDGRF